jgi:formylglycine-generating enzyme required for sulfatase activity
MSESPDRVYRGNHWYNAAKYAGRPARGQGYPGRAVVNTGFRLVHDSEDRTLAGGSWGNAASGARVATRGDIDPANAGNVIGFRLTRDDT